MVVHVWPSLLLLLLLLLLNVVVVVSSCFAFAAVSNDCSCCCKCSCLVTATTTTTDAKPRFYFCHIPSMIHSPQLFSFVAPCWEVDDNNPFRFAVRQGEVPRACCRRRPPGRHHPGHDHLARQRGQEHEGGEEPAPSAGVIGRSGWGNRGRRKPAQA